MKKGASKIPNALVVVGILICVFTAGALIGDSASATFGAVILLGVAGGLALFTGNVPQIRDDSSVTSRTMLNIARTRVQILSDMASTLGASLNYAKVLDAALDIGVLGLREVSRDARLTSMVMLFEDNVLKVVSARGVPQRDLTMVVPGREGLLGDALEQAGPVIADKCSDDPELAYFSGFKESRSVLVVPLRSGFQNYGVLVYGTITHHAFSEEHAGILAAISTQATIALQNAVLYQNLLDEKERIVEVEEEARKKLARDLHDGPTQNVSAIAMRVNAVRGFIEKHRDPATLMADLEKIEDLARKTTKEIRSMLFTLRPLVLETQGLTAALGQLQQKLKDTHDLNVLLQIQPGVDEVIEQKAQGALFYIIEEAVNNARKYAQAAHIYVRLFRRDNYLIVEVQDDGVGFDVEAVKSSYDSRGSLGMVNMQERAELAGGTLRLDSAKDKGTKITIYIPLKTYSQSRPIEAKTPSRGTPAEPRPQPKA